MTHRYTKAEVNQLLHEAARADRTAKHGLSLEEVAEAAQEAGIDVRHLENIAEHLDRRRGLRIGLFAALAMGLVVCLVMIFNPPASLGGWHRGALSLHNEHRSSTFDVDVRVPTNRDVDCSRDPSARADSDQYDTWRRVTLRPGARVQLDVPQRPAECPIVWIRTLIGDTEVDSATLELPIALEIERDGRLDQKGAGRPQLHPPPLLAFTVGGET